jgi:ABC-type phosphate/phosphonate transport system substrate-binding protein
MYDNHFRKLAGLLLTLCLLGPTAARAADPIRIRIYSSVYAGIKESRARLVSRAVTELLSRRLGTPLEVDVQPGKGAADLKAFGDKLADGTIHLGVVWGLEYGWLRQMHPELVVLSVCSQGAGAPPHRSLLLVRSRDRLTGLKDLKGKKVARYEGETLMDRLFLNELVKSEGGDHPEKFFQPARDRDRKASLKDAVYAVQDGDADCAMVSAITFVRMQKDQPRLGKDLVPLAQSDTYPEVVMIGSPRKVGELNPTLWEKAQKELRTITETAEGEQLLSFWRFRAFVDPTEDFVARVKKCAERYPISHMPAEE